MFGFKKKEKPKGEEELFLESVKDEPLSPDPCEPADKALEKISHKDSKAHYDIVNLLVLTVTVLFFGTAFLALSDKQDFTDNNQFSKDAFLSGKYLTKVERKFNDSLPLKDLLHNADSLLNYCFGYGNKTDLVKVSVRREADDPYSISNPVDYSPLDTPDVFDDGGEVVDDNEDNNDPQATESDDGKYKKLDPIRLTPETTEKDDSEAETSTTTNNKSPSVTTTTTVPPETTQPTETEPPETTTEESKTETEPPETEEPQETEPAE